MLGYNLNAKFIDLIKQKANGNSSDEKTVLLVVGNIVSENIEVTDENKKLVELQIKINDICNFILSYLDIFPPSQDLKENIIGIMNKNIDDCDKLILKDEIISASTGYVKQLYDEEKSIMESLK